LTLEDIVKKYITNDDVGGGLPKMVDLYFHPSQSTAFIELTNLMIKRAYLELFDAIEKWLCELKKCVELFASVGNNNEMTKLADERIDEREKLLQERRVLYNLSLLQENF
jgi:hypothetical protein